MTSPEPDARGRRPYFGIDIPHCPAAPPPPQLAGGAHVPQLSMTPPHPSPTGPQLTFRLWQVCGTHPRLPPQAPAMPPPPHVMGGTQGPQLAMVPPHPSVAGPHVMP